MRRCDPIREMWKAVTWPDWCRKGLCGVSICVDPVLIPAYEQAAKDIASEISKTKYIFRAMPSERCVALVYSYELAKITYDEFITKMAATIYPKGNCPPKIYWKFSMLKSGIYCADDLMERLGEQLNVVLACANESRKEREVAIKSVGGAYYVILGPVEQIYSPLFR